MRRERRDWCRGLVFVLERLTEHLLYDRESPGTLFVWFHRDIWLQRIA